MNCEHPDVQAGFRKDRGTRDQIASIHWITKKQESSRKTPTSALLTIPNISEGAVKIKFVKVSSSNPSVS